LQKSNFNLVSLVVIVVLLGLLSAMLFPAVSGSMLSSNSAAVGIRGKDIYVAITAANTEREPLGLGSVWPKSNPPTNHVDDISQMNFTNSTDYFYALYDGEHVGTAEHNPYVRGFDYSKLAGAGVPAHYLGKCRLKPENNLWTIGKNVRDTMEEIVPVLVTRNLAAESLVADLPTMSDRRLCFDEEWKTPFGNKMFIIVRKGGGIFTLKAKYARVNFLYGNQTFQTTISGSHAPLLGYLTPSKEVIPSEAGYQACAKAQEESYKWYRFVWLKEVLEESLPALICFLILGLISSVFIFVRVFFDRQLKEPLSILGPVYWILLWLSVTSYLYCPVILFFMGHADKFKQVLFVLALAPLFQIAGCFLLALWRRRNSHVETYRMAFGLMVLAPVIALQCLVTLAVVVIFPVKELLVLGLAAGAVIRFRISDKTKLPLPFSVMGSLYWVLLWLAVTAYMLCLAILLTRVLMRVPYISLVPTLVVACLFHVLSCLYLVVCNRRSGNLNNFKTVLLAFFVAPVVACQSLMFTVVLVVLFEIIRGIFGMNY
jgi:hypothetical protein